MGIDNETAMWLWELRFGEKTEVQDRKGRVILKNAYRHSSDYGWKIYYNIPRKRNRPFRLRHFEIVHIITCAEKALTEYRE
jgi:hypothetical protein